MHDFDWSVATYGLIGLAIILIGLRVVFAILQGGDEDSAAAGWVDDNLQDITDSVNAALAEAEATSRNLNEETLDAKRELDAGHRRTGDDEEISSLTRAISEAERLTAEATRARREIKGE